MALGTVAIGPQLARRLPAAPDAVCPRRSPHVQLGAVRQRGGIVYRAHDRASGRTSELSRFAARLLLHCDGQNTTGDLLAVARRLEPGLDDAQLTRSVSATLGSAESLGLIVPLAAPPSGLAPPAAPSWLVRTLRNPLFARFSLFSPDPLIERMAPLARALFTPPMAIVWATIVGFGLWLCAWNWDELVAYGQTHALEPTNLLWLLVLFPAIKVVHELGHALACKRWGGEVRDFGVMLLVLVPIPFVDCSDSAFFSRRRQRIVVAAAGMMVEFVIATVALGIWIVADSAFLRLLAFNTLILTSITTIVFNANPLLRFDAYYILSELIGVDNLGTRSQRLIQLLARRLFLGDASTPLPTDRRPLQALLVGYGIASFAYKCTIVLVVVITVFPRFFIFGIVLAAWGGISMIVIPLAHQAKAVWKHVRAGGAAAARAVIWRTGVPLALLGTALAVPLPHAIVAEGLVRVPPESAVRVGTSGTVSQLPVGRAAPVSPGATLLVLDNDILAAELAARQSNLRAQQLRRDRLLASDIAQVALAEAEIRFITEDIRAMTVRQVRLDVLAHMQGSFALDPEILPGRFVEEGEAIGIILPDDNRRVVLVTLSQEAADLVRSSLVGILVRSIAEGNSTRPANLVREYPLAGWADGASNEGRFVVELAIEDGEEIAFGQLVAARFDLGLSPLALQAWHTVSIWFEKLWASRYVS